MYTHSAALEGSPQRWADEFTCARKPTPGVLAEHGMLDHLPSGGDGISRHMRAIGYRDMQQMCPTANFYINRRSASAREVCMEIEQLVCGDRG
ncbi:hypothetical protein CYMTET_36167 [Cymbomonas tetramitiformis]|uniref:Uncharacterized protein n=1 Tax=Cymbomonas tetramitiformis TaxID=36881 RepID=A0AAE0CGG9_9CHLO|nr:hypothetical protein CYMTET_36167 [Cymbomonas tetramitiformis]